MRSRSALLPLLLALGACNTVPSAQALRDADYGSAPGGAVRDRIRAAFAPLLIDAGSAEYRFAEPEQGWGKDEHGFVYGWVVMTEVNSRNQFGAFTGWQTYKVLARDGDVHSIYQPAGKDLLGHPQFDRVR